MLTPRHTDIDSSAAMDRGDANISNTDIRTQQSSIVLPRGGGAIRGIGESFRANPITGSASFRIPLPVSSGRGFEPELSLSYDSGAGNGPFGLGWAVSVGAISRRTDRGLPKYDDAEESDTYMLTGSEDLVPLLTEVNGRWQPQIVERSLNGVVWNVRFFRPRVEGTYARIERWRNPQNGVTWFRVTSASNVTSIYGLRESTRVTDPEDSQRIFTWQLDCSYDDKGNYIQYDYKSEDTRGVSPDAPFEQQRIANPIQPRRYLKRVLYALKKSWIQRNLSIEQLISTEFAPDEFHFQTVFDYGDHGFEEPGPNEEREWRVRHDPFSDYRAGFEIRTWRRCQRVMLFHQFDNELAAPAELVRSLSLRYDDETPGFSLLTGVTSTGHQRDSDGTLSGLSIPETTFSYQSHRWNFAVKEISETDLSDIPAGVGGKRYQWVDLYSEGLSGVLSEHAGDLHYKRNLGNGRFGAMQRLEATPSISGLSTGILQVGDLDANGTTQIVSRETGGYFSVDEEAKCSPFQSFSHLANVDFQDPDLRILDLTGDGRADLVISQENGIRWYPSQGTAGFESSRLTAPSVGEGSDPVIVFGGDESERIIVADMSGDGLQDIVRIRNGSVVYWPNLGYGRFGAMVTMGDAPYFDHPDQFDPMRIQIADFDGSGPADLAYLDSTEFRFWRNLNGNSWSDSDSQINPFPGIDPLGIVSVMDLLGHGTACLVWSSEAPQHHGRSLKYVDLMGGKKPWLMTGYQNGFGKEVRLQYTPSTRFYLDDTAKGQPWITRLHFPVHCMSKVESIDHITNARFSTTYTYHHGYYDHVEREFRGFGRVDQIDTEVFEDFAKNDASNPVERSLHQSPVLTRTWYHTGFFIDREQILTQYQHEYFPSTIGEFGTETIDADVFDRIQLPEPQLPANLTTDEWREALRACKGLALRSEVYGLDGTSRQPLPYSITEKTVSIRRVQPAVDLRFGVFQVMDAESIELQIDRDPSDPRISHNLVLESDAYGNPTLTASVGYARQNEDSSLPADVRELQSRDHIVISSVEYTRDAFGLFGEADPESSLATPWRLPVTCGTETFELFLESRTNAALVDRSTLVQAFRNNALLVGYEDTTRTVGTKRLLSSSQMHFTNDTLDDALPFREPSALGLSWQSFQLAFTPTLLNHIYADRVDPDSFLGGYVDLNGDGNWWVPSGTPIFDADASEHFFLPAGSRDALGHPTRIDFDDYQILPVRTRDAKQNESLAINDYRMLSPRFLRDANHNWSGVKVDALGRVVASAVMGKVQGLTNGASPAQDSPCEGDNLNDPTVQFEYDLNAWSRDGKPCSATTTAWEEHFFVKPDRTKTQTTVEYSDGSGNVVMIKKQTTPGLARRVAADGSLEEINTGEELRWIGNGRVILNNKGNPVRQYEPYFSVTSEYEDAAELVETGVSPILFYDPIGRNDCKLHPNHTYEKVVSTPWQQSSWDSNDTLFLRNEDSSIELDPANDPDVGHYFEELSDAHYLPTWYASRITGDRGVEEQRAAEITESHVATPAVTFTDSLGRPICVHGDNGSFGVDKTLAHHDIEGNLLSAVDGRSNTVMTYHFNMLSAPDEETPKPSLYQNSMDGGEKWTLANILGQPLRGWDSRDHVFEFEYDELNRPTESWLTENGGRKLVGLTEYTDSDADDLQAAIAANLIGTAVESYDQTGRIESLSFDFQGNSVRSRRSLSREYKQTVDWDVSDREAQLESEVFNSTSEFDSLNRVTHSLSPHHDGIPASANRPTYNESGGLDRMNVSIRGGAESVYVKGIDYDAKGQRQRIEFGNGVVKNYEYEPDTFRLSRLRTVRSDSNVLQDLNYTYDPVGNITQIRDFAQQAIFFNNTVVEPHKTYVYDPIYRLIEATGREHIGQNTPRPPTPFDGWDAVPHPNDGQAMRRYTQKFKYDEAGNIKQLSHIANAGSYVRRYAYEPGSNRLTATTTGDPDLPFSEVYSYNAHGSIASMPHLRTMDWDAAEHLRHLDLNGGGNVHYVHDAQGGRIRKVVSAGSLTKEYIQFGNWEIYRQRVGDRLQTGRETLRISDDEEQIAIVETVTSDQAGDRGSLTFVRYQLSDQLGSAHLEVDQSANVISHEEYHPYGSTAYYSSELRSHTSAKRYRYTGGERDEESGLSRHGHRYLASHLGRWCSVDPSGLADGKNLYAYVGCNPVTNRDPTGLGAVPAEPFSIAADASEEERVFADFKKLQQNEKSVFRTASDDELHLWTNAYLNQDDPQAWYDLTSHLGSDSSGFKGTHLKRLGMARVGAMGAEYSQGNYAASGTNAVIGGIEGAGVHLFGETVLETVGNLAFHLTLELLGYGIFKRAGTVASMGADKARSVGGALFARGKSRAGRYVSSLDEMGKQLADDLVDGLRGHTKWADDIADAIDSGALEVKFHTTYSFETLAKKVASQQGLRMDPADAQAFFQNGVVHLRAGTDDILEAAVHEGTHGLDYLRGVTSFVFVIEGHAFIRQFHFGWTRGVYGAQDAYNFGRSLVTKYQWWKWVTI